MPLHVSSTRAHRQEVKILLYSLWYHHTWDARSEKYQNLWCTVHETVTYRYDDTRGCIVQFWPPDDEHIVLETCRGMK